MRMLVRASLVLGANFQCSWSLRFDIFTVSEDSSVTFLDYYFHVGL